MDKSSSVQPTSSNPLTLTTRVPLPADSRFTAVLIRPGEPIREAAEQFKSIALTVRS